ncbi:MAG: hypothetical protein V7L04_24495 [Nostoc sp.]|uniref:hypothetical protein n=1 Tax=Nostoc sp. TaxID=1180 RepID=UPI002FF55B3E
MCQAPERSLKLVEFDDKPLPVYASIEQGQRVISVWLDIIYQQLAEKLRKYELDNFCDRGYFGRFGGSKTREGMD